MNRRARPKPGDVAVCIGCAGLLMFTPQMRRRKMTYLEQMGLSPAERAFFEVLRESVRALPPDPLRPR